MGATGAKASALRAPTPHAAHIRERNMSQSEPSRARSRCPPPQQPTFQTIAPAEQTLLKLIRRVGYGTLTDVPVQDGVPVLNGIRARLRRRLGKPDHVPGPTDGKQDFVLKQLHLELLAQIRAVKQGRIVKLEIQDGLPVHLEIEEELRQQSA
jgi:hypothetical protein